MEVTRHGGTFPFTATDKETHVYGVAGEHDLTAIVRDDDRGWTFVTFVIRIG